MTVPRLAASPLLVDPTIDPAVRARIVPVQDNRQAVLVELDLGSGVDPGEVRERFLAMFERFREGGPALDDPEPISGSYLRCLLDADEIRRLLVLDRDPDRSQPTIFRVWPDYILRPHIDRSVVRSPPTRRRAASGRSAGASCGP